MRFYQQLQALALGGVLGIALTMQVHGGRVAASNRRTREAADQAALGNNFFARQTADAKAKLAQYKKKHQQFGKRGRNALSRFRSEQNRKEQDRLGLVREVTQLKAIHDGMKRNHAELVKQLTIAQAELRNEKYESQLNRDLLHMALKKLNAQTEARVGSAIDDAVADIQEIHTLLDNEINKINKNQGTQLPLVKPT